MMAFGSVDPPAKPPPPPPPPPPPVGGVVEVLEVAGMSDAVTSTVPLGCDVRAKGECLRHLGLHLRDLVGNEGIEGQRAEHDPDDLRISGPHAGPPSRRRPSRRTWTSPRAHPARTRTPRGTGRSARTG